MAVAVVLADDGTGHVGPFPWREPLRLTSSAVSLVLICSSFAVAGAGVRCR